MSEHGEQDEGRLAVPGPESADRDETLSPDERGTDDQPVPASTEPTQPTAKPPGPGIWERIRRKLRS